MTSGNETRHTTPPVPDGGDEAFEEEFDRLLGQSSAGAANAVAVQAMTPDDVVDKVQGQAPFFGGWDLPRPPGQIERTRDVDDVLLDLVRWVAQPPEPEPARRRAPAAVSIGSEAGKGPIPVAVLRKLAEAEVFGYVRRDVARAILDLAFGNLHGGRSLLRHLARTAADRSGIAEEIAEHLHRSLPGPPGQEIETIKQRWPLSGTGCPDIRALVDRHLAEFARRVSASAASPVRWWDATGTAVETVTGTGQVAQDMRDALVDTVVRFGMRWYSGRSAILARCGRTPGTTPSIGTISATLLGLLHGGPLNSRFVLAFVNGPMGFSDVTRVQLREELRNLYLRKLVRPVTRVRVNSSDRRYQLTGSGQREFQDWLLAKPGGVRGAVVLCLLRTTPFTPEQYDRLLTLSTFLDLTEEQVRELSRWAALNLRGVRGRRSAGDAILENLLTPGRKHVPWGDDPI